MRAAKPSKRRWAVAMGVGLAALAVQVLSVAPAAAATLPSGSVTVESKFSGFVSANTSLAVKCPAGKRVVGASAQLAGSFKVFVTEARPFSDATGDGVVVSAEEDQTGESRFWTLSALAFCATAPRGLDPEIVTNTTTAGSLPVDQIATRCPAGKSLIGSGGRIVHALSQPGHVQLSTGPITSGPTPTGSVAFGTENDAFTGNYQVTSYAVCARPTVFSDFQVIAQSSSDDATSAKSLTIVCPDTYRVIGTAAIALSPRTHIQKFMPNNTTSPSRVELFAHDDGTVPANGTLPAWHFSGFAYCAR